MGHVTGAEDALKEATKLFSVDGQTLSGHEHDFEWFSQVMSLVSSGCVSKRFGAFPGTFLRDMLLKP